MDLLLFRSVWSGPDDLGALIAQTQAGGFNGIEGPIPKEKSRRQTFRDRLDEAGLAFIAEVATGTDPEALDWWVPRRDRTAQQHLDDLRWTVEHAGEMGARFVSTMCGYDGWSWEQNLFFFEQALGLEEEFGITISFETHRGRSLFNPWVTRDLLNRFPQIKLTCDFSHWCVVCERLLVDEQDIIERCALNAQHLHCRVGYAQHAQVSDPRAPEFAVALTAHEHWWQLIWDAQAERSMSEVTMTPEFLWDGYLMTIPYTQAPVADLWEITVWMAQRERQQFENWLHSGQILIGQVSDPKTIHN
ncbi:MAG: TIM barrel protein [Cyanobacteria bacterium P01_H01_bin.15]